MRDWSHSILCNSNKSVTEAVNGILRNCVVVKSLYAQVKVKTIFIFHNFISQVQIS